MVRDIIEKLEALGVTDNADVVVIEKDLFNQVLEVFQSYIGVATSADEMNLDDESEDTGGLIIELTGEQFIDMVDELNEKNKEIKMYKEELAKYKDLARYQEMQLKDAGITNTSSC